jgi:hypothetical protein
MMAEMNRALGLLCMLGGVFLGGPASAQHHAPSYEGQQQRAIKALSAEEVEQYLAGAGMGYAKAAELNGYPGPMHALDLAAPLGLSSDQRERMQALMAEHKAHARKLGAEVVRLERELDTLFSAQRATPEAVDRKLRELSTAQADYRGAHLKTHIAAAKLLTPAQIARYHALRGYGGGGGASPGHPGGH